jgi:RNA polymerase primary sigma factor
MADATSACRSPARDLAVPDALSAYLSRISRVVLLTHREEVELGRRVRAGDRIARRTLIERNLRLVVSVAVRYRRSGVPLEDLIQDGNIGLIEAVERFDPERGYRFSSYAVWRIRKAIQKAVAAQSRTVRVPRTTRERMETLGRAHGELRAELGREPRTEEAAKRLGWTVAEVRDTMGVTADARSLDQPYGTTQDAPALAEFVADGSAPDIPDTVARRMELDRLRRVVETLPERARHVVVRRYGLDGREPARLAELAAELGISSQGVSQLQQRSVRRLKAS